MARGTGNCKQGQAAPRGTVPEPFVYPRIAEGIAGLESLIHGYEGWCDASNHPALKTAPFRLVEDYEHGAQPCTPQEFLDFLDDGDDADLADWEQLAAAIAAGKEVPPLAVWIHDGQPQILDGEHRAAFSALAGRSTCRAYVYDDRPRGPQIDDLIDVPTEYNPLDSDGEWLMGGGCVHLAIALKEVFPEGKIAVSWYSDHGRRAISHAVFYNPLTGMAWDGCGSWEHWQVAISGHDYIEQEDDADVATIAAQMGIPYDPEQPFADDRIMDAWMFAERHFLPELHAQTQAEYGPDDDEDV